MLAPSRRSLLHTLERERKAATEERAQLISTICRLAGNPGAAPVERPPVPLAEDPDRGRYIARPENLPE